MDFNKTKGHWLLAKMGKKILRPGGKELSQKLIELLNITNRDDVVEFAPGLGFTASLVLSKNPKSYVGVDADEDAVKLLKQKIKGQNIQFIEANAAETNFPSVSKSKVFGEAMLTMQADNRKLEIIREAHRILKKGGFYAIHELALSPDGISEQTKATIQKDLALAMKVNARPLTKSEWRKLLEDEGFEIKKIETSAMHLLEPKRILDDEGFFRTIKIGFNILSHPAARKRIMQMRNTFIKNQNHINAIVIVAQKK